MISFLGGVGGPPWWNSFPLVVAKVLCPMSSGSVPPFQCGSGSIMIRLEPHEMRQVESTAK